jgi:hypothetical protein
MGLLDGINDPEFMKRIEERRLLVEYVAGCLNLSKQEARAALDHADAEAIEWFCEGNSIPQNVRH